MARADTAVIFDRKLGEKSSCWTFFLVKTPAHSFLCFACCPIKRWFMYRTLSTFCLSGIGFLIPGKKDQFHRKNKGQKSFTICWMHNINLGTKYRNPVWKYEGQKRREDPVWPGQSYFPMIDNRRDLTPSSTILDRILCRATAFSSYEEIGGPPTFKVRKWYCACLSLTDKLHYPSHFLYKN